MKLKAAVFASGGGSNFQALLDHQSFAGGWRIVLLVSDREDGGALKRAEAAGVETAVVATVGREPGDVARQTLDALGRHGVELILLAGYLKLVPTEVLERYRGRVLNIHPALLPSFGGKGMYGMKVHRAVIESGVAASGATVHFVDEEYDRGTVLAQRHVVVRPGDTPEELAARILTVEHQLYPAAVDHLCAAVAAGREPTRMSESGEASGLATQGP